jgi:hypothetical protein
LSAPHQDHILESELTRQHHISLLDTQTFMHDHE